MTNNCEWELAVLNDSVVFCFRVRNPGPGSWGSIPCFHPTPNRFENLCLTWWRRERRVVSCRSTAPSDASCCMLQDIRGGEELIAQKKNNHQWLKVFHEPCLSCWQFCYNHSQHTALLLCEFICCQLPCSYFVCVLVGDSSLLLCFHSPQTQAILWPGCWILWGT